MPIANFLLDFVDAIWGLVGAHVAARRGCAGSEFQELNLKI